jgi:excisionase family DNA binding protein
VPKSQDLYGVLGVPRTATAAEVRRSFRALARLHHPDVNRGDAAAERRFQRITAAYRVLGNRRNRLDYDERLLTGRFAPADLGMPASFQVDQGPIYHGDLGHHSDFYQAGDPLTVSEAAVLVNRDADWLRRAIRTGRLPASRRGRRYLLRRRDLERLDRTATRRTRRGEA